VLCGGNWTDAAWSSACKTCHHLRPTSTVTLIVSTGPLPRKTLTVAGIVAGAWEGYYALLSPARSATGLLVDEEGIRT
jgi:hypothetical protein